GMPLSLFAAWRLSCRCDPRKIALPPDRTARPPRRVPAAPRPEFPSTFAPRTSAMLVLSRRPEEKIVLPTVPAVIKVIAAQSGLVRLGIEAPGHIPIVREELLENDPAPLEVGRSGDTSSGLRHVIRSRMNNLNLGLALLRMELTDASPLVRKTLEGM